MKSFNLILSVESVDCSSPMPRAKAKWLATNVHHSNGHFQMQGLH